MKDERYEIFEELAGGATAEEKAVILELLKEDNGGAPIRAGAVVLMRFLLSYSLALSVFFLELLRISVMPKKAQEVSPNLLFGSSAQRNTTNIHLRQLLESTDRQLDVVILDSPIRRFENHIFDHQNIKVHWCRTPRTDALAILHIVRCLGGLHQATVKLSKHRSISIKTFTMSLVRLLRGISISRFLTEKAVSRLVFSLSGNACTSIIEHRLKGDTETIHWLHGVGLGFNFDSFSDQTLVNNEYDHRFYENGLCGGAVFFPDNSRVLSIPKRIADISTVAVYSNLIHPNNEHFKRAGVDLEEELLNLVSSKLGDKDLFIKPHPVSFQLLGNQLDHYLHFLGEHGFRLLGDPIGLIPEKTLYISTISTSFIDLIAAGTCAFMYDKYGSHRSGFQHQVSSALKFHDSDSLSNALRLIESAEILEIALKSFSVQSQKATFRYLLSIERDRPISPFN